MSSSTSEQNNVSLFALIISLIALVIAFGQLLQQTFGTADRYRRANVQIIGPFAQTRKRLFHFTELRLETVFSTPHIKFGPIEHHGRAATKNDMAITYDPDRTLDATIDCWIRARSYVGRAGFLSWLKSKPSLHTPDPAKLRNQVLAAGWLILLDQVWLHQKTFVDRTKADKISYTYGRPNLTELQSPVIEMVEWSWDLMPPDVVRPLASINLGDLLILCYRLRIVVDSSKIKPAERAFSADGNGHNFSPINLQGLGFVLQYRFDRSNNRFDEAFPANMKFIPSRAADQLAFGIIPESLSLGITHSWDLGGENYYDAINTVLRTLNVSDQMRRRIRSHKGRPEDNDALTVVNEILVLLCPFLPISGLGIVKYICPLRHRLASLLNFRESRLVFRHRLGELTTRDLASGDNARYVDLAGRYAKPPVLPPSPLDYPKITTWVACVLDFLNSVHSSSFRTNYSISMFMKNASSREAQARLDTLLSLAKATDACLLDILRNYAWHFSYEDLVGAHLEKASGLQDALIKQREKKGKDGWRNGTGVPGVSLELTEMAHRYVDAVEEVAKLAEERYRASVAIGGEKLSTGRATDFNEDIRCCWWLMMLRGCLWELTNHRIELDWLPFRSRYWEDSTQVLLA